MNKTLLGILSAIVILNTACSPKQDTAPNSSTQSSTTSNEVVVATTSGVAITPAETPSPPNGELLNTYWKLILINDTEVTVAENQSEPHLTFNAENRVSGSDGCNRIMGSYLLESDKLTLDEMAGTKMACAEGAEQTQAFNDILTKVAAYTVHSDQLELRDATGLVLARFKAVALP
ncbi:MAG: META domain-containing protein [Cellvibrio sp.]|uniref:META domain-containing protein n=1 Tax=Cellvibrio sp. TaxID=1965322 RepID=UPI0027260024|nr:META domain-containing protein [Cellvibrio sp.]